MNAFTKWFRRSTQATNFAGWGETPGGRQHIDTGEIGAAIASANVVTLPPPDVTNTPDRYRVDVKQNIPVGGFDTTAGMRYRWTVVSLETGRIVKTGYSFTTKLCYATADNWARKQQRKGRL